MRRWFLLPIILIAVVLLASAQTAEPDETTQTLKSGETVTKALTTVTSTAISPLLGVSVLGAWQYYKTPGPQRGQLPFFERPYFWAPVMVLLVLIFIKDTFGGFAPLIKKPLDAIEVLLVNHASLILIVFPVVMNQVARVMGFTSLKGLFASLLSGPVVYSATAQTSGIHHAFSMATAVLYLVVGFVITGVVWLLGHCFDVMALISPFPFVDFVLKAIRNTIFAVLLATSIISPHLGLVLALVVIVVAFLLFGWALRLAFFGSMFAWSLLEMMLFEIQEKPSREDGIRAFSAGVKGVSKRTYGKLAPREDGNLTFAYRRLLVGPEKTVVIGRANSFAVARGVFYPNLVEPIESADKHRVVFRMLPTYRGVEEEIRECLDCVAVKDLRFGKGLRSFWKFVTDDDSGAADKAST
jgi:hypothetical protein